MNFKKAEKKETLPKEQKRKTLKVGTRRKTTFFLWMLLVFSLAFGIYKNFTAIDTHTITEKEVIEKRIVDTNKIENFVQNFVNAYYTWENTQESIDKRLESLKSYMTEELRVLNAETVRTDVPNSSAVKSFSVWNIEQVDDNQFRVLFSVKQIITEVTTKTVQETVTEYILDEETNTEVPVETKVDKEEKETKESNVKSAYTVVVYVDDYGDLVITNNPTISRLPEKSDYEPVAIQSDGTVDASTSEEITGFLNTFFTLYPKASEKELEYYVKNNALEPVEREYVFSELINPVYSRDDNQVTAVVSVAYLDAETNAVQISQFKLTLEKVDNWAIVKAMP